MQWETPSYSDVRCGFEVTMYINKPLMNRAGVAPATPVFLGRDCQAASGR